jgi:hypothetical protein
MMTSSPRRHFMMDYASLLTELQMDTLLMNATIRSTVYFPVPVRPTRMQL